MSEELSDLWGADKSCIRALLKGESSLLFCVDDTS